MTMEKIQTVKMKLAFPMCSLYEFWGSWISHGGSSRKCYSWQSKCLETPSRTCPIELPLWCVRFGRSICRMPNWQGNSRLTMTPLRRFLNPSCKSNKTAKHSKTPGVSVDTGSWRSRCRVRDWETLLACTIILLPNLAFWKYHSSANFEQVKTNQSFELNMSSRTCLKTTGAAFWRKMI